MFVVGLLFVTCCPPGGTIISDDGCSAVNVWHNGDGRTDPRNYTLLSGHLFLLPPLASITCMVRHTDAVAWLTRLLPAPHVPALDSWELFPALIITWHLISIGHTKEFAGLYASSECTLTRKSVVSDMHTTFSPWSAELHLCVESHHRTIAVAFQGLVMDPVRLPFLPPTRR